MLCSASEQQLNDGDAGGEEELASIIVEGLAKTLLHAHLWTAPSDQHLQASLSQHLSSLNMLTQCHTSAGLTSVMCATHGSSSSG